MGRTSTPTERLYGSRAPHVYASQRDAHIAHTLATSHPKNRSTRPSTPWLRHSVMPRFHLPSNLFGCRPQGHTVINLRQYLALVAKLRNASMTGTVNDIIVGSRARRNGFQTRSLCREANYHQASPSYSTRKGTPRPTRAQRQHARSNRLERLRRSMRTAHTNSTSTSRRTVEVRVEGPSERMRVHLLQTPKNPVVHSRFPRTHPTLRRTLHKVAICTENGTSGTMTV